MDIPKEEAVTELLAKVQENLPKFKRISCKKPNKNISTMAKKKALQNSHRKIRSNGMHLKKMPRTCIYQRKAATAK